MYLNVNAAYSEIKRPLAIFTQKYNARKTSLSNSMVERNTNPFDDFIITCISQADFIEEMFYEFQEYVERLIKDSSRYALEKYRQNRQENNVFKKTNLENVQKIITIKMQVIHDIEVIFYQAHKRDCHHSSRELSANQTTTPEPWLQNPIEMNSLFALDKLFNDMKMTLDLYLRRLLTSASTKRKELTKKELDHAERARRSAIFRIDETFKSLRCSMAQARTRFQ